MTVSAVMGFVRIRRFPGTGTAAIPHGKQPAKGVGDEIDRFAMMLADSYTFDFRKFKATLRKDIQGTGTVSASVTSPRLAEVVE